MKKALPNKMVREMRGEYDFPRGVRGKLADQYAKGTNIVVLDEDISKVFRTSKQVNDALRALVQIIRQQQTRKSSTTRSR
jgi:hypothetical protein